MESNKGDGVGKVFVGALVVFLLFVFVRGLVAEHEERKMFPDDYCFPDKKKGGKS